MVLSSLSWCLAGDDLSHAVVTDANIRGVGHSCRGVGHGVVGVVGHASNSIVGGGDRDSFVGVYRDGVVGDRESVVVERESVVDMYRVSLSICLPLNNMDCWSVLGDVGWANSSIGDSGVMLRVLVAGEAVGGHRMAVNQR